VDPESRVLAVARDPALRDDRPHPRGRPLPTLPFGTVPGDFTPRLGSRAGLPPVGQEDQSVSCRDSLEITPQREFLAGVDRGEPGRSVPRDPAPRCYQRFSLGPLPRFRRTLGSSSVSIQFQSLSLSGAAETQFFQSAGCLRCKPRGAVTSPRLQSSGKPGLLPGVP